jgi:hypothetical protein
MAVLQQEGVRGGYRRCRSAVVPDRCLRPAYDAEAILPRAEELGAHLFNPPLHPRMSDAGTSTSVRRSRRLSRERGADAEGQHQQKFYGVTSR